MKIVRAAFVLSVAFAVWRSGTVVAQTVVDFPDPNLKAAVRSALSLTNDTVTRSNLTQLISLTACGVNITNLLGLEWATNLTSLDVSANLIRDLSPLGGLTRLTNFNAGGNLITSLHDLSGLTKLDILWLNGNPLQSLGPATNLTRLRSLTLYASGVSDISPLARLTDLTYLELRWNPLTNVQSVLPGLTNLTTLYLGGTALSNVTFLQNLRRLEFLNLDHNQIEDPSPLAALPVLSNLDLSYNPLTNVTQVGPLTNLAGLYLSGNSISNVAAFTNVNGLTSITLFDNRISDLLPLAGRTNLQHLGLSWNPMVNLAQVAALTNLTTLWLDGNSISNLSFVQGLTSLKALGFRHNRMSDLGALSGLTNLTAVFADHNRLTNIVALQSLPGLSRVQLTGNLLDLSAGSPALATITNLQSHGASVAWLPQNAAPAISGVLYWNIATNTTSSLGFQVSDDTMSADQLSVTVSSSNPVLIPNESISATVLGVNGTLTVTPAFNQVGPTTLTLTVTDAAGSSTDLNVQVNVVVPQLVSFGDPDLTSAIRERLGKFTDPLTTLDLEGLTDLSISDIGIFTLAGLEQATNLTGLMLKRTDTTNLTAVPALRQLTHLQLHEIGLTDLSLLAGLTNLTALSLEDNSITNLGPLHNLTGLNYLSLDDNAVSDISTLSGLTNLEFLSMNDNLITNLAPIQNLPRLAFLDIRGNLLNTAKGSNSMTVIESLLDRDVEVDYLPQKGPPTFVGPATWNISTLDTSVLFVDIAANGFSRSLSVSARSSNTNLLPNGNVLVAHYADDWWTMAVTTTSNQTGATTITIFATNDLGFSRQWSLLVTVASPLPFAGNVLNSNLVWRTGANAPWSGQSAVTHDGLLAARSGSAADGQPTWLETTLQGPGILSFWWRVSSQTNRDWLECYVDGALSPPRISGEVDWQRREVVIASLGTHKVRWQYAKDFECCEFGSDAAWLDQVSFVPLPWLELAGRPTNGVCPLILHPVPGRLYEVQASTNLTAWFRLAYLLPTNSPMPFLTGASNSPARFYRLLEFSPRAIRLEQTKRVGNQIQMVLLSPPGLRFEMQASTNLSNWSALTVITNTLGTIPFTNTVPANAPARFYRAKLLFP